jgi:hypothetical protein
MISKLGGINGVFFITSIYGDLCDITDACGGEM